MNMQALMKQAQTLQKDMTKAKEEIDKTIFEGENALVKVKINGAKEIISVEIDKSKPLDVEDIELLEDMVTIAINNALKKADKMTEEKMGKFSQGMPGLF